MSQHLDALAIANERRTARAVIKRELRTCHSKEAALELAAQHVEDPDRVLCTLTAFDLIRSGRSCGDHTALRALNGARVSVNAKVGAPGLMKPGYLTDDQRASLAAVLRDPNGPSRHIHRSARPKQPPPIPVVVARPVQTDSPSLASWCGVCAQWAIPMNDGTCGFCDNFIDDDAAA